MTDPDTPGRRRGAPWWAALAVGVLGAVLVVVSLVRPGAAPELDGPVGELPDQAATSSPADGPGGAATESPQASGRVEVGAAGETPLAASQPERIRVPALDIDSDVIALGLADDGSLAVPQPGPDLDKAAWFENSPTPGQTGPSIIEGHVSTDEGGPSIFFELAELTPGDRVEVDRADGTTVTFEVEALREFAKDRFPTELVYGGEVGEPTLRLITCSSFDPDVGNHTGNLVVFTRMVRVDRS